MGPGVGRIRESFAEPDIVLAESDWFDLFSEDWHARNKAENSQGMNIFFI
jgi:hypothetical protein